jgi:type IV pilus assembly protein PilM
MISDLNQKVIGLDISDRALRLVQLKNVGKKIFLHAFNEVEIPAGIINNSEIQTEKKNKLTALLNQLLKSAYGRKIKTKNVIAVLPEQKTFIKVISVDSINQIELPNLVVEEIKNHIPLSIEEIYFDWQIIEQKNNKSNIVIGAAPINTVNSYLDILESSNLTAYALEIEASAIIRSLLSQDDQKAKIIIDFGAVRTGLIVYDHKTVQFTVSLPISGNKITETIAQTLHLDANQAEKSKIVCGLDPEKCEGALLKILTKPIDNLTAQIKKAMAFYRSNFSESQKIEEIILCGGGANFSKIDQILSQNLKIPVKIGNPFINLSPAKINIPDKQKLSYTTAIGLALRPFLFRK